MPTVTRILGIDPGGTNGLVVARLADEAPLEVVGTRQITDLMCFAVFVAEALESVNLVICERFVARNTAFVADAPSACEPIGIVKLLAHLHAVPLHLPVPSARLAVTDAALKRGGYWIKGQEHSRQALRHVLAHAVGVLRHAPTVSRLHPRAESKRT